MSKRRQGGEIVYKKPGAGFFSEGARIILVAEDNPAPCTVSCGDNDCREWTNAYLIRSHSGFVYHVSECDMEDVEAGKD